MTIEKLKTGAEAIKVVVDIVGAVLDRIEKRSQTQKRIADLEAEVARLKGPTSPGENR